MLGNGSPLTLLAQNTGQNGHMAFLSPPSSSPVNEVTDDEKYGMKVYNIFCTFMTAFSQPVVKLR